MSLVQHKLTLCSHLRPLLVVRDSKTVVEKIYVRSGTEGRESPHVPCGESKSRINVVIEAQGPSVYWVSTRHFPLCSHSLPNSVPESLHTGHL